MNSDQEIQCHAFLPYMADVARCELSLHELNQMWRLIEASAKMNCPAEARLLLPAMVATRTGFAHLERSLVADLVQEKVRQVLDEIGTKAQYAIDILVRNLFERTADVGFLATDVELCRFVAGIDSDQDRARERLSAYRDKYTVYDEIVLLGPEGRVLVQADPSTPVAHSHDPLIAQTLATDGYVETFRATDLRPGKPRALIYSHRMRHPDSGALVGVLCLCFHFEQEMAAIFDAYRDPAKRSNMLLLDAGDRVIGSADALWIPPGAQVPTDLDGQGGVRVFGGREYLVRTFVSSGYQGYPGPAGWKGQVMIPLELAFRASGTETLAQFEPRLLQGLLSHAHSFSPSLHELMASVTNTTRTIERIVWNGKVASAANDGSSGKLNTVLDQITETGERSDALFSLSIQDLYQTVLASSMRAAEFTTQLLVDMLDRNLYERANDCRWWALTAQLRRGLTQPSDPEQALAIGAVLQHINSLYTVYSRLFVYDRSGCIIASSGTQDVIGTQIDAGTLARVCALRSPLDHYPEPFAPAALYDGQPTFIYHAAVRHPEQEASVVGGIGIVFDARPELLNMLHSGVAARPNMHAFLVTPAGQVLSGTDPDYPPGALLDVAPGLLETAGSGASTSRIAVHRGQYVIAACSGAAGYREFRAGDSGEEPVLAVLLESFGPVREEAETRASAAAVKIEPHSDTGRDFATFFADRVLMAIAAANIQEAVPFSKVQKAAGGGPARLGMLAVQLSGEQRNFVWVFDLAYLISGKSAAISANSQVVLTHHAGATVGLMVDDLHSVHQFDEADINASPLGADGQALSTRLIKANKGGLLIQEICVERLFARLRAPVEVPDPIFT